MKPVLCSHIEIDERGVARIKGTRFKVRFIVTERMSLGMTPEEIVAAHPDVLTLAQVYAALSYYYDNRAAMDLEIARGKAEADRLRAETQNPDLQRRLRDALRAREAGRAG